MSHTGVVSVGWRRAALNSLSFMEEPSGATRRRAPPIPDFGAEVLSLARLSRSK